jgi:hypothetical protein
MNLRIEVACNLSLAAKTKFFEAATEKWMTFF